MYKFIFLTSLLVFSGGCIDSCGTVQPTGAPDARADVEQELEPTYFPDEFQSVSIRGHAEEPRIDGNSLEGAQGAFDQGIRHVEIDFEMSADERIVAAHGNHLGGDCPNVRDATVGLLRACTMNGGLHVATLGDVLGLDFESVYIDLKATGGSTERAERAVKSAIDAIVEHKRIEDAVLMTYKVTPKIVEMVRESGVRAGLKGYPNSPEESRAMVDKAAEAGFEMICVNLDQLPADVLTYSAELGIWHLAWHLGGRDKLDHFKKGARAGIGGLITRHVGLVESEVAPQWQDVRLQLVAASEDAGDQHVGN